MLYEIDSMLAVDENGIVISEGETDVWIARLDEWLKTSVGTVYGLPGWGNSIADFLHEPIGSDRCPQVEVAVEASLMKKLRADLPGIALRGVGCKATSEDTLKLDFAIGNGTYSVNVRKEDTKQ